MEIWVSTIYLRKEMKVKITEKRRPIVNACTKAGCNPRSHGLRDTQVWISFARLASTHWSKQVKVEISEIASSCNGGQGRCDTSPVGLENLRMPLLFHGTRYSATRRLRRLRRLGEGIKRRACRGVTRFMFIVHTSRICRAAPVQRFSVCSPVRAFCRWSRAALVSRNRTGYWTHFFGENEWNSSEVSLEYST